MNQKELNEIRRRFKPDRTAISKVYGCYVSSARQIISYIDAPMGLMSQEEQEMFLNLLKKSLSGALGRNLIDIVFSTAQVADSDEHRLLQTLRQTALQDPNAREILYRRIIDSIDMGDSSYLILLAADAYDVPRRGSDDQVLADGSDTVFKYFVCSICPVKDPTLALRYSDELSEFHSCSTGHIASPPELGFLFPAFDDRAANIYSALYYTRDTADMHDDFVSAVFNTDSPMPAAEQKETFQAILQESLQEECSLDVVQTVHETISGMLEERKADKTAEPLTLSAPEVKKVLEECGVSEAKAAAFEEHYTATFGEKAELPAVNMVSNKFKVSTPAVNIQVDPEHAGLIETRMIDGRRYIVILADGDVEVNGVKVYEAPEK